jgi:DNA-nicking Smr family endonuclease
LKRPRLPTEEERALFHEALKGAKPLRGAKKLAVTKPPKTKPAPTTKPSPLPVISHEHAPRIGGHLDMRLRRGRVEPEARLDLHGLREAEAYRALEQFLMRARSEDKRLVLVITGKGGVLRNNLPRWLAEDAFREIVAGVSSAHLRHGGTGAFYVALKRKKPKTAR